jgi:T-complex protein 1 subunit eta
VYKLTTRAAEILKEVKPFVEEGVGSHIIIKGLKAARDLVSLLLESRT